MKDVFTKTWITENAIEILREYSSGELTIRGLHYRLVSRGMTNDLNHYKRVVNAMIDARWNNNIQFRAFSDHDREIIGFTHYETTDLDQTIERGKQQILAWMSHYRRNRWERQPYYPEVFIEKKALQGVFEPVCFDNDVALGACKGYPSLTFLNNTFNRLKSAFDDGHKPIILYFGDYDPSGEDIPRAIRENLLRMYYGDGMSDVDFKQFMDRFDYDDETDDFNIEIRRIALMESQVVEMGLPPAPIKDGDTRSAKWNGLGQVELDAIDPKILKRMCKKAIDDVFDESIHDEIMALEEMETETYKIALREYVNTL
jgi:hypothetical protein